jgi:hypothetical protein
MSRLRCKEHKMLFINGCCPMCTYERLAPKRPLVRRDKDGNFTEIARPILVED